MAKRKVEAKEEEYMVCLPEVMPTDINTSRVPRISLTKAISGKEALGHPLYREDSDLSRRDATKVYGALLKEAGKNASRYTAIVDRSRAEDGRPLSYSQKSIVRVHDLSTTLKSLREDLNMDECYEVARQIYSSLNR